MSLSNSIEDREFNKFRDNNRVAVTIEDGLLSGVVYDEIQAQYPSSTTEHYLYLNNSVLQATVEIIYTNSSKNNLSLARRL